MRNLSKIIATLMASLFLLAFPSVANGSSIRRGEPPAHYADECPQAGSVIEKYDKKSHQPITVYLPYGYDENRDARYDVYMMLHQAGAGDMHSWIDTPVQSYFGDYPCSNIYDWMIYEKLAAPFIVISINLKQGEDSTADINAALLWAVKNLRTYAEKRSFSGIEAAREHFFVGGLSMGAWKTTTCMKDCFELFGNYVFGYGGSYYYGSEEEWKTFEEENGKRFIKNLFVACGNEDQSYQHDLMIESALRNHAKRHMFKTYQGGHSFAAAIPFMYNALAFIYEDYSRVNTVINGCGSAVFDSVLLVYEKSFGNNETY